MLELLVGLKSILKNIKNQEEKCSVVKLTEFKPYYETITLLKNVNNFNTINITEAIIMYKNKNKLFDRDLNPLQNSFLKLFM